MPDYYEDTNVPVTGSRGASSVLRTAFDSISAGFAKVAQYTGNGGKLVRINAAATAQETIALGTANQVVGMNSAATGYEHKTIAGTANQVTVAQGAGTVTLSAPQDLHTGASPTFVALVVSDVPTTRTNLGIAIGTNVQAYDADLDAVAGLAVAGIIARTGAGAAAARTITAGAGVTITNGDGVAGNPTIAQTPGIGLGDVVGPVSAVNNRVAVFDGTTGRLIKDSGLAVSGSNTGDQTSIVGITGTIAQFSAAVTDADLATLAANTFTGTQTFVGITDTVFTITDAAAFEINPANGSVQIVTLGASRTPAATSFAAGQTVILGIDDGSAFSVTWTTVNPTWVKAGGTGAAPTLATTGYTWILFWKVGSVMYAAEVGKP